MKCRHLFASALLLITPFLSITASAHLAFVTNAADNPSQVAVTHTAYLMTAPEGNNVSELHIINTSDTSQQFFGTLYGESGARIGEVETLLTSTAIPSKGRITLTSEQIRDLFGSTWSNPAMLEVFGAENFSLMVRLRSLSGLVSNNNCATSGVVHNLDGFDSTDIGFIRFINTGTSEITNIKGSLYDASGNAIGTENVELLSSLAAKQQVFINRNDLGSKFGVEWNGTASLYVSAKTNLKMVLVNFISANKTFFNFSCFDGSDDFDNPVVDGPQTLDITNTILTSTSADCADYANMYFANVNDIKRSLAFKMDVDITEGSGSCTMVSDGIPNHDFNQSSANFAHDVKEISATFNIPRSPQKTTTPTQLSQGSYDAVMLNGVVLDILSAGCYNPNGQMADKDGNVAIGCTTADDWLIDPLGTSGGFGVDIHNAHTQPDGRYHYHGNPNALFDSNPGENGSPVIGFAADGFPIFGTYFKDPSSGTVRKAVSGYTLKSGSRGTRNNTNPGGTYDGTYVDDYEFTSAGDLDECNGMTVNGQYGYYVTEAYPWVLKCLSGTPDPSFNK